MANTTAVADPSRELDERSWWDLWNTSHRTKDQNDPVSSELFDRVAAIVNGRLQGGSSRMLEVACGAGAISRLLDYSSYHGLDISPAAIEIARQKSELLRVPGRSAPTYEAADFHDWPLPGQPLDIVLCVDAISCFRDQKLVLSKMARCLKPGGHVVITTINPFVFNRIRRSWQNGPVSHWLTRRELHALVTSAGFVIENSCTIMPRGNLGILRLINSGKIERMVGPRVASIFRRLKERAGLGQYFVVVARKDARA